MAAMRRRPSGAARIALDSQVDTVENACTASTREGVEAVEQVWTRLESIMALRSHLGKRSDTVATAARPVKQKHDHIQRRTEPTGGMQSTDKKQATLLGVGIMFGKGAPLS